MPPHLPVQHQRPYETPKQPYLAAMPHHPPVQHQRPHEAPKQPHLEKTDQTTGPLASQIPDLGLISRNERVLDSLRR